MPSQTIGSLVLYSGPGTDALARKGLNYATKAEAATEALVIYLTKCGDAVYEDDALGRRLRARADARSRAEYLPRRMTGFDAAVLPGPAGREGRVVRGPGETLRSAPRGRPRIPVSSTRPVASPPPP